MMFPFSVRFNKRLEAAITPENQQEILQYTKRYILEDKADNIIIEDLSVMYRGSTSHWRESLFGSVDNGTFSLNYRKNSWFLIYRINMRRLFIDTAIMSAILEGFVLFSDGPWWVGIAMLLWLCGGNWIVNLVRHESVAFGLAAGIDELICGKVEPPEHEKIPGKLKSWF